jgi:type IV pilus assembly protein PilM
VLDLFKIKQESFGLDISDLSIKIAKLKQKKASFELESFGEEPIAPAVINAGEIEDQDSLIKALKKAVGSAKGKQIKTKYVVVSLPEEKAFFQIIQMPKVAPQDLRSAVIYEAENYIPVAVEDAYLDFKIVSSTKNDLDHLDVLLVAMPKLTVDPYVSSLKSSGLQPVSLEVESLAISRALIQNNFSDSPILIIDFGATRTGFIIFSGNSLSFTSSITVSSSNFTDLISKNLSVKPQEAEKLKKKHGLEEKIKIKVKDKSSQINRERGKIFDALVPALVDLIQQIKKHLYYYQTHSSHQHLAVNKKNVSKILLCGGGSNLKGLPQFLRSELKIPVELADPWTNILGEGKQNPPEISPDQSLGYTTALGLALRAADEKND